MKLVSSFVLTNYMNKIPVSYTLQKVFTPITIGTIPFCDVESSLPEESVLQGGRSLLYIMDCYLLVS